MVKQFQTASTRITVEEWDKYSKICSAEGCSPHADLKRFIEGRLNEYRTKENVGTHPRKIDEFRSEASPNREIIDDLDIC